MEYTVFDFETATTKRMACQLGLVIVKDNKIIDEKVWLIQPPDNFYNQSCIKVHNITEADTCDCDDFECLWVNEISHYFENKIIVSHSLDFDKDVLKKNLKYYGLEIPDFAGEICTYKISKSKLIDLVKYFEIDVSEHHNALFDAKVCAKTLIAHLNGDTFKKVIKTNTDKFKIENGFERKTIPGKFIKPNLENKDPKDVFYNKKVVFTGDLETYDRATAAKKIFERGADVNTGISKSTNIVVVGSNPGPKKMEKIHELKKQGFKIKIMREQEFVNIVKSFWDK